MYAFLVDENNRIIQYVPTNYKLVSAETERPAIPNPPKIGIDYVEYWNEKDKKIEWKKVARELTEKEKELKELAELKKATEETQGALQEMAIGMLGGGM